jgi:hypothetical protein
MKVIFLDIDGVLNCDKTPNPRKFPYLGQRFLGSNHIRQPRRVCKTKCGRPGGD